MKLAYIDIEAATFTQDGRYVVRYNEHHRSEPFTIDGGSHIEKQHIEFPLIGDNENEQVKVELLRISTDSSEEVVATETMPVKNSLDLAPSTVDFKTEKDAGFTGSMTMNSRFYSKDILESLQSTNTIYGMSINAMYPNNLKEFELGIQVKEGEMGRGVVGLAKLSSLASHTYIDMKKEVFQGKSVELKIWDLNNKDESLKPVIIFVPTMGTSAVSVPVHPAEEPVLLTIQFITGDKLATSMIHTSAMREATVTSGNTPCKYAVGESRLLSNSNQPLNFNRPPPLTPQPSNSDPRLYTSTHLYNRPVQSSRWRRSSIVGL